MSRITRLIPVVHLHYRSAHIIDLEADNLDCKDRGKNYILEITKDYKLEAYPIFWSHVSLSNHTRRRPE